jgi:hypothetical protein
MQIGLSNQQLPDDHMLYDDIWWYRSLEVSSFKTWSHARKIVFFVERTKSLESFQRFDLLQMVFSRPNSTLIQSHWVHGIRENNLGILEKFSGLRNKKLWFSIALFVIGHFSTNAFLLGVRVFGIHTKFDECILQGCWSRLEKKSVCQVKVVEFQISWVYSPICCQYCQNIPFLISASHVLSWSTLRRRPHTS